MVLSTLASATGSMMQKRTSNAVEITQEDKNVANQISNITGVNSDEILDIKRQGKSWNEVLEILKNENETQGEEEQGQRSQLLAEIGREADVIKSLREDGYTDEELTEANIHIERLIFQLKEITSSSEEMSTAPSVNVGEGDQNQEDISNYSKLLSQIDSNTATYLMLKLRSDLGSMKDVLDEYLYALQIEIDLEKYIEDKESYEEEKREKSLSINQDEIITLEKIEAKMLEKLQQRNEKRNQVGESYEIDKSTTSPKTQEISNSPDFILPQAQDTRPQDPLADVMDEINNITNRSVDPTAGY